MTPLNATQCEQLAEALEDAPETVITIHALRTFRCRAFAIGEPRIFRAAIVDPMLTQGDLLGFGDPDALFEMITQIGDWNCLEVAPHLAVPLSERLAKAGWTIRQVPDVYYTMPGAARGISHPNVRLLGAADADFYAANAPCFDDDPDAARQAVIDGPIAAAMVNGKVVAAIEANVRTARYANFCAETLPEYRGKGFSSACASVAAQAVQSMGLTPVWSTSENNLASRRVAEKVGFVECSRWIYLIPEACPSKV